MQIEDSQQSEIEPRMNPSEVCPNGEDVSPEEIAAVERVLSHIERQNVKQRVLGIVAQWFLVLGMFKELERHYTQSKNRKLSESKHRALLSSMMALGDILLSESESLSDQDFKATGYTRESLTANVRYLREKYEQWFVEVEEQTMKRVWEKLQDECEVDPSKHFQPKG